MQSVKKRGKSTVTQKAENALSSSSKVIDLPSKLPPNLILHLRTKSTLEPQSNCEEALNPIMTYDPSLSTPSAYDPCDNVSYLLNSGNSKKSENIQEIETNATCTKNKDRLCWWCCHNFDNNKLIKLPIKKKIDLYECVGNFCSPACTCAYILESGSNYGDQWRQYELLHEMLGARKSIRPAPKKELLNIFGGKLDIITFRGNSDWHILYPPMVSLKLQMDDTPISKDDTLPFFDSSPIHINSLKVDELQIENLTDKKKRKNKKNNNNDTLDRFW